MCTLCANSTQCVQMVKGDIPANVYCVFKLTNQIYYVML